MKKIKLVFDPENTDGLGYADWKDNPGEVLQQIDRLLEPHSLEIVTINDGQSDQYIFRIDKLEGIQSIEDKVKEVTDFLLSIATLRSITLSEVDAGMLRSDAKQKLTAGWTVPEVVEHLRLTEEMGCPLSEDEALKRMSESFKRVEARINGAKS